jgi:hypothetical protein
MEVEVRDLQGRVTGRSDVEVRDGGRIEFKVMGGRVVMGVMRVEEGEGVRGGMIRAVDEGKGVYVSEHF